jgi:hypothetical protein
MDVHRSDPLTIGLLWRGDPHAPNPPPETTRHHLIFAAFERLGVRAQPVIYDEAVADAVQAELLALDGVLVWVDPISDAGDRSQLDPMLRDVAAAGVFISTHPDVILKMGTKEVLFRTRSLGWGVDTRLYASPEDLRQALPARLAHGPRVLKQKRGNGGIGVWKVELGAPSADGRPLLHVLHARRGSVLETLKFEDFIRRCEPYFDDGGLVVDQPFQPRLPDGMIRCYVSQGTVVGYGYQLIKALIPPPPEGPDAEAAQPGPRIMHPPEAPQFQALRREMEGDWIPRLQRLLDIETTELPALWDADFLYGPKTVTGEDTYVLCEINVSSVAPYPDTAAAPVAAVAKARTEAAREARRKLTANSQTMER